MIFVLDPIMLRRAGSGKPQSLEAAGPPAKSPMRPPAGQALGESIGEQLEAIVPARKVEAGVSLESP
jgi:hypothetical protein